MEVINRIARFVRGWLRQALCSLPLTGVRTGELRYATPEQFDFDHGVCLFFACRIASDFATHE
jgi:integrase